MTVHLGITTTSRSPTLGLVHQEDGPSLPESSISLTQQGGRTNPISRWRVWILTRVRQPSRSSTRNAPLAIVPDTQNRQLARCCQLTTRALPTGRCQLTTILRPALRSGFSSLGAKSRPMRMADRAPLNPNPDKAQARAAARRCSATEAGSASANTALREEASETGRGGGHRELTIEIRLSRCQGRAFAGLLGFGVSKRRSAT
ncbi:hypothetical protein ACVWYH_010405 [Bradyrhizobium sp. GM24.11]